MAGRNPGKLDGIPGDMLRHQVREREGHREPTQTWARWAISQRLAILRSRSLVRSSMSWRARGLRAASPPINERKVSRIG